MPESQDPEQPKKAYAQTQTCDELTLKGLSKRICALLDLLRQLKRDYPKARIVGHYQLSPYIRKACPCFDAVKEYEALYQPNASAIRLTTHGPS